MTNIQFEFSDFDLLTPKQAAIFLGGSDKPLALSTLALWRNHGEGPSYIRIGKSIRYPVTRLKSFMQSMTVNTSFEEEQSNE